MAFIFYTLNVSGVRLDRSTFSNFARSLEERSADIRRDRMIKRWKFEPRRIAFIFSNRVTLGRGRKRKFVCQLRERRGNVCTARTRNPFLEDSCTCYARRSTGFNDVNGTRPCTENRCSSCRWRNLTLEDNALPIHQGIAKSPSELWSEEKMGVTPAASSCSYMGVRFNRRGN